MQIVCDTSCVDGDGCVVVSLVDPFQVPAVGVRVALLDERTERQSFGRVARCDVEALGDGTVRVDLRVSC